MPLKPIVQGLAVVWLLLFVASFLTLRIGEAGGAASGLNRVISFLTWQLVALVVAAIGAFATRQAVAREIGRIKLIGYGPLALSVFLVASFIAIMGFRVFVAPLVP